MHEKRNIVCPSCALSFFMGLVGQPPRFCPFCAHPLFTTEDSTIALGKAETTTTSGTTSTGSSVTLVKGHLPSPQAVQFSIGSYQILRSIGKGGMGEVFLAYDTVCGRRVALKKIRTDLLNHSQLYQRFLKEARITSQLAHPAIIPIYTVHEEERLIYYTMPFVEGDTLKQLLRSARTKERKGEKDEQATTSIPALLRIFITVCQAIAYAHSKGVLHRDIKPENVIVGKYGEVLILDWGLAKLLSGEDSSYFPSSAVDEHPLSSDDEESEQSRSKGHPLHGITHLGKVVGTISYMAPERAKGQPATIATDIYALGVILYQILTLQKPFHRGNLKEFRKTMSQEVLIDPARVAPHRDVPPILSQAVEKALHKAPDKRYRTVDEMIHDMEAYLEGRSEWHQIAELNINDREDWMFQENILISDHVAIMRHLENSDWVSLMVSKVSYPENIKIEATVRLGKKGNGVGFLLALPEGSESVRLNEGYLLWLGSDLYNSTRLLRSRVEIVSAPDICLKREKTYRVRIEKVDTCLHLYIDDVLQFSSVSYLPLTGTHIGFLSRDANFVIEDFKVFASSHTIMVKCLAVPDAFLAHKDYDIALSEYRRIAYSFPGRAEGREALFKAGITLLEQGSNSNEVGKADQHYDLALTEFEKLQHTAGAPLAYLGKALVYEKIGEYEEEIKCFELAYRRYPNHPLLPVLQEQIICRIHECSQTARIAAYRFMLLAIRYLSIHEMSDYTKKLFDKLQGHWEELTFIEEECSLTEPFKSIQFGILLAFWLSQPHALEEFVNKLLKITILQMTILGNALFSLAELEEWQLLEKKIGEVNAAIENREIPTNDRERWKEISHALSTLIERGQYHKPEEFLNRLFTIAKPPPANPNRDELRTIVMMMARAIDENKTSWVHEIAEFLSQCTIPHDATLSIRSYQIWACLLDRDWTTAGELLQEYPEESLHNETSILHFLYGCWLFSVEGTEVAYPHFMGSFDVSYPHSWALFGPFLKGGLDTATQPWFERAFPWEKRQLYRQAALYYHCIGDEKKAEKFRIQIRSLA